MQNAYPDYYPLFHCIADRCRHNCCIGWEIDVDEDSLAAYDQIGGEMGERLHKCIDRSGEMPHFILSEQERCPFLNGKNLCDLILYGGEGMLCQICTEPALPQLFFGAHGDWRWPLLRGGRAAHSDQAGENNACHDGRRRA